MDVSVFHSWEFHRRLKTTRAVRDTARSSRDVTTSQCVPALDFDVSSSFLTTSLDNLSKLSAKRRREMG